MTVCKMDTNNNNKYEELYGYIEKAEDALLLAQLAMCNKRDDELIFIFPGWNIGIKTHHKDDYEKAMILAEKYKVE